VLLYTHFQNASIRALAPDGLGASLGFENEFMLTTLKKIVSTKLASSRQPLLMAQKPPGARVSGEPDGGRPKCPADDVQ
jgi:hypothetical protein